MRSLSCGFLVRCVYYSIYVFFFFFFKQKTAYEISACLVGSEMCIRDRNYTFSGFSKAGNAVVRGAIAAAQDMGHTYVGTEHLLLALARDDTGEAAAFLLERQVYGYQVGRLLREQVGCGRRTRLSPRDFTPALSKCVDCAVIEAKAVSDGKVEPVHLLAALLEAPATAGRILVQLGVEPAAAAKECGRRMGKFPLFQQTPRPVTSPRGAARAAEKYGKDLTSLAEQDKLDPVLGRDSELLRMEQILVRRRKNNPCLVGEPGVGKTAVVEGLARRIAAGQVPPQLRGKRILSLDITSLVAGTKYPVSYTHLRAHETGRKLVCRLLLEKKKKAVCCRRIMNIQ